jgi:putative drug exporter of the RND superfamily
LSELEPVALRFPVRSSWLMKLGHFSYRYRRVVIGFWAILVALSLAFLPQLEAVLQGTGAVYEAGSAHRAEQRLRQELQINPDALTIVFQAQNSISLAALPSIQTILNDIRYLPNVRSVVSVEQNPEYRSGDGRTQYAIVNLQPQIGAGAGEIFLSLDQIQRVLNRDQTEDFRSFLTGKSAVDRSVQEISKADLGRVELIALPLTLIALLFVFGSVIAAGVPVAMSVMTVSVAFGLLYLVSLKFNISVFSLNITTMLGLGLGIDYSLLVLTRFREELVSKSVQEAVVKSVDTAGRAVFFSGLTVCIGLVSLLLLPIPLVRSLGIAGALVVLTSVLAALTLLPALLGMIGHQINWGRHRVESADSKLSWATIAHAVIRYRLIAIAAVLAIVFGLTSPFFSIHFGLPDANILPPTASARKGVNVLEQAFGLGESSPILLAVHSKSNRPILSEAYIETLYPFVQQLQADSRVARVNSLFNLDPQLNLQNYQQLYRNPTMIPVQIAAAVQQLSSASTTLITVVSRTTSNDISSQSLVKDLRALSFPDLEVQVAGQTAIGLDTIEIVYQRFPWILGAIIGVTFLVLCVLLKSIVLPLKAIVMNFLSIGASFGTLVFVFQDGNFQTWLNFTAVGYLDILLPVVLFCVVFGLSMDYEVFLLTRIKEIYDRSSNNSESVIEGLQQTGGMITSAALLMIIVTSAFAFTSIIFVKALGVGTAIAVLIDATLIRTVLVPATMHLMGKWNWWLPAWLRS